MCPALTSGLSRAAAYRGDQVPFHSAHSKPLCPELVFRILSHRLLRHVLHMNFYTRQLAMPRSKSINPSLSQQGPNDTCHFVGERDQCAPTMTLLEYPCAQPNVPQRTAPATPTSRKASRSLRLALLFGIRRYKFAKESDRPIMNFDRQTGEI
jgi:hypothetical protein